MFNLKEYRKKYYLENREKTLKLYAEKYIANKEYIKERTKKRRLKETQEQREKRLLFHKNYNKEHSEYSKIYNQKDEIKFKQYHSSASRRSLEFSLTIEQFEEIFHKKCRYCGDVDSRGIDRVDNKIGYTINNSEPCCEMCNKMKWRWTEEEFKGRVEKIYINLFK